MEDPDWSQNPLQNGKEVTMTKISPAYEKEMDKIVKKYTGWDSLQHMCLHTPTLMVSKGASANESQAIYMMREAYRAVTGKEAHPAENWDRSRPARKPRR